MSRATRNRARVWCCALILGAAVCWFAPLSRAQNASLQGIVQDSTHQPILGASVSLIEDGKRVLATSTDAQGAYAFVHLAAGTYVVRAEISGNVTKTSSSISLGQNEAKHLDLTLDAAPQFFDEPHFTVAGVTDASGTGGHGSDAVVKATNGMVKSTVSLSEPKESKKVSEQSLREAIARNPKNADLYESLADIEENSGRSLDAVRDYQRASELDPSEPNLFAWGAELLLHHASDPAIEVFRKGHERYAQSSRILIGLGVAEYSRGSYEQATKDLCAASDLNPVDPNPYLFLGKFQTIAASRTAAADEKLKRFAELQPDNALADYYYALSLWYRRAGSNDPTSATVESLLQKAVNLDPKLGLAYFHLGIVYAEKKNMTEAISAYQKAVVATPELEEAHYRLAQAYKSTGQTEKAQQEFQAFEQIRKDGAAQSDRERHEIQQFVYTLRNSNSAAQNH